MGHEHSHSHAPGMPEGVYDVDYYHGRQKKRQLIYRLQRRTDEVERSLKSYTKGPLKVIVDIGTADALMLQNLRNRLGPLQFLGLDYSLGLLQARRLEGIWKARADALKLPVKTGVADAIIATAVIEHLEEPSGLMRESARVLRPGGLLIVTTPAPFMEKVASALGIWKEGGHQETLNLKKLRKMALENGFSIAEAKPFMFSPIGFPAEKTIEKIFGPIGLRLVMANQLLVARKE